MQMAKRHEMIAILKDKNCSLRADLAKRTATEQWALQRLPLARQPATCAADALQLLHVFDEAQSTEAWVQVYRTCELNAEQADEMRASDKKSRRQRLALQSSGRRLRSAHA